MAGITLLNVNLIGVASRTSTTRLGDGGVVEQMQSYACRTAARWHTIAQARVVAQQLREMVWYSRHAGGIYITSDDHTFESGLYRLVNVDATPRLDAYQTAIIAVDLSLVRLGGVSANVTRRLHIQSTLQTNSWSYTATPWHALPVGALAVENPDSASFKARTTADGSATNRNEDSSVQYVLTAADHNAAECKVWDTAGSADTSTWVRVYGPDHQFSSPAHCAIDNALIRFNPIVASPGLMDLWIYESSGSAWREMGDYVYTLVNSLSGTAWYNVLITELTPWRVTVVWRWVVSGIYVTHTITIERGRPMALVTLAASSSTTMRIGILGTTSLRFTLGRTTDYTTLMNDANDYDTTPSTFSITDAYDNWLAFAGDTADRDVMGVIAARTSTNTTQNAASSGGGYLEQTSSATFSAYVGGIAYDTGKIVQEAEAASLVGTAATATVSGASGGTPNCVELPALNDRVDLTGLGSPPALGGTASIIIRAYVRMQNTTTSGTDQIRVQWYNSTTAAAVGTPVDFGANTLGSGGTWKWTSAEYNGWNGTDTIYPRVTRIGAGGGGTFYVDLCVSVTIDSANGNDGPKSIANDALTENLVWAENVRVGV